MSDIRIDSISLEVDASAALTADGIDHLTKALTDLKSSAKLTSTANNLTKLASSLQTLQSASATTQRMKNLASAINQLSNVKDLGNFKKAVNTIKNLAKALDGVKDVERVARQMQGLASAVAPLENIGKTGLGNMITQLKKLPDLAEKLDSRTIEAFTRNIRQLSEALMPLANQMNVVSAGFVVMPRNIGRTIANVEQYNQAANRQRGTLGGLRAGWLAYGYAMHEALDLATDAFVSFTERYETMNLFSVSMGEYTEDAYDYAMRVQEALGVNASEWAYSQGVFMQLISGFGEVRDQAYRMSKGLTEITYDISSLFNLPIEEAFTKVQSGISGELEPLRRLGFDLSVARLEEIALANGIDKKVAAMNQAEKSELRYIAITEQMPNVIGDMSRTLQSPANALRVLRSQFNLLSQTIGSLINVVVSVFIPYIMMMTKVIVAAANAISVLLTGKSLKDWDTESFCMSSNLGAAAGAAGDVEDSTDSAAGNLKKAADNAKKAKQYLMGWDELNVINDDDTPKKAGGGGGGVGGVGGGGLGLDLDSLWTDEMLDGMNEDLAEAAELVKTLTSYALAAGAAFAAWRISNGFVNFLNNLRSMGGLNISSLGFLMFASDLAEFARNVKDIMDNGADFKNVSGLIANFAGMLADAFLILGRVDIAGALKVVQGVLELTGAIADIAQNGFNVDNVMTVLRSISNVMIGFGLFNRNKNLLGAGLIIQGVTTIIRELAENWDAIMQGDWSGVDQIALITAVLEAIGGLLVVFNVIKGFGEAARSARSVTQPIEDVTETTRELGDTVSGRMSPTLSNLARNLGMGLVIIAEVAAAAMLIAGAIYVLGVELAAIGDAWQPVIDNGGTVLIALGAGVAILGGVGLAMAGLGSVGQTLAVNMALGMLMLVEVGLSTALFLAEILVIGLLLAAIGDAWQPVLDNGLNVAIAIGVGTATLLLIGIAAAALGVVAVGTAGLLPLAIGAGTLMLLELGLAAGVFCGEIIKVGNALNEVGIAWQPVLDNAETIAIGIGVGTVLLIAIGAAAALLGVASVATVGLLPLAIAAGTAMLEMLADAFVSFSKDLIKVANEISANLAPALQKMADVLPGATKNMEDFTKFMGLFAVAAAAYTASTAIAGLSGVIGNIVKMFAGNPLRDLANNVKATYEDTKALNANLEKANPELEYCIELLTSYEKFIEDIEKLTNSHDSSLLSNKMLTNMKVVGENLVTGFSEGISNKRTLLQQAGTDAGDAFVKAFEAKKTEAQTAGGSVAEAIRTGLSEKRSSLAEEAKSIGTDVVNVFNTEYINGFNQIGKDIVDAIAAGIRKNRDNGSSSLYGEIRKVKEDVERFMSELVRSVSNSAKDVIRAVNEAKSAASSMSSMSVSTKSVTKRASGGTVPSGQLFLANEAGPELVGSIGNTTTVMNNDQIVSAVSSGVAQAVASVMGSGSGGSQKIEVYLDGEKIYANQKKIERNKGVSFDMGAFAR